MLRKLVGLFPLAVTVLVIFLGVHGARAEHTPNPGSVTIAGSLQSELGCPGDWQPDCAATHLTYHGDDDVWQGTFTPPAGSYEYKAALNNSWDENYGANASPGGANIALNATGAATRFYYDHKSHWITDNVTSVIAVAPGNFQSELGCPGDWSPDCLRSWLQDADGDGIYTFNTSALPTGNYEAKVALNESWDVNYGAGGVQNGPNIPFSVMVAGSTVTFSYNATTHVLEILVVSPGHNPDNNVEYFGLGHNSHDDLYRTPFGAIPAGETTTVRFRTYHNDVTGVRMRVWDTFAGAQSYIDMALVASDVSCYDPAQPEETCDFWEAKLTPESPRTLYYWFVIQDGTATAFYNDDSFFNGGWGEATPGVQDDSYVITVYDPNFTAIDWMQNGVIYQIFPDRFRNGHSDNDSDTNEPRYGYPDNPLDQIINKEWGDLPEGYCRNYVNPAEPCEEGPRGRDYFGGDLRGVFDRLVYLNRLGVTVIYFNPIFEAGSNHAYDTQDYYQIDHFFGTLKEFIYLTRRAEKLGIKVVLDGVFNHVSSDSKYFDRYGHFREVGACESVASPYRAWFTFRALAGGPCAGPAGPNTMTYDAWFGFDSLPVLDKNNVEVKDLIYAGDNSVAAYWLELGAAGWRLDVMGDSSFPAGFWSDFRAAVKEVDPDGVIIGELWKKHEILPKVLGDQADTSMNYRFRNAVLGFFGQVDFKGFPDDGQSNQPPSLFAEKLISVREDNPDASYYTMMNLLGSHDTQRILWALTPGERNREQREFNAANLATGKQMLHLATIIQMTIPGAPTIYYGDEVGVTGEDDPDDRRTFPWGGGPFGIGGDASLWAHYRTLTGIRRANPVLRNGEMSFLLLNDTARTLAYLMRSPDAAAVVAINRNETAQELVIPLNGRLPDNVRLRDALRSIGPVTAVNGVLHVSLPALTGVILLPTSGQDLQSPNAPANLTLTEGNGEVSLAWDAVADAAEYNVYRSPVSGGGYVLAATVAGATHTDNGLQNGKNYYYIVKSVDAVGNEGAASNEASGMPHLVIGWANLQWPPTMNHTISVLNRTEFAYGQAWIDGATSQPGPTVGLLAQLGFGPVGSNPAADGWTWVDASFNVDAGNNDEFRASLLPDLVGTYHYVYRYSTTSGRDWLYADLNGPVPDGATPANPGVLTVNAAADVTPPATPTELLVVGQAPTAIDLAWDALAGDATLYGYEVLRSDTAGGPYTLIALTTLTTYTDLAVVEGNVYYYVVRAVDLAFNRSGNSNEVQGNAALRTVTITFNVTTPAGTPAGMTVYIAGTLNRLDGGYPEWNPGGVAMNQSGPNTWTFTFTGREATPLEYKYTLGSWDFVEKGPACEEITNRSVTLNYGASGVQTVNDTVANWRNVLPCGN